jgi:RNA polymerase sigma factor (sigma-70 family)
MAAKRPSSVHGGRFPPTRRSAVALVGSDDPAERARSFDILVRAYWKPVYKHLRVRWRKDAAAAQDLTQGFFARAFERRYLADYDAGKALFRTYLKTCLDRFVMEAGRAEARQKRGGGMQRLSLDFDVAEEELDRLGSGAPEQCFDREWKRDLLASALAGLEERCAQGGKERYFAVFSRHALASDEKPSYRELAGELGLSVSDVTNYLSWSRRAFREILLARLRDITASVEEYESEARALLGGKV